MKKEVRCVETGEIFASVKEAADKYFVCPSAIRNVVNGHTPTCLGLTWEHTGNVVPVNRHKKPVKCIETGDIFPSLMAASKWAGISVGSFASSIRKGCRSAGYSWELV